MQPFQFQAGAVNLPFGTLDERPRHVFVWPPQHRQRAHPAAQIALGRELEADFDPPRVEGHGLWTKRLMIAPYSAHENRPADSAAARAIAARSRVVKNSSTARASASGSSGGTRIP